ncbi:MAG: SDR family oxidoreductase, partial [Pseudomonadales bacterium]|nr:SDR family oxidoreductase [Pseudomonadales bacterium]
LGYNIRVNCVLPGMIQTPMLTGLIRDMAGLGAFGTQDPKQLEHIAASLHPIGRFGAPEEIAKGILFLASEDSSYMTGAELIIDGGYIAR